MGREAAMFGPKGDRERLGMPMRGGLDAIHVGSSIRSQLDRAGYNVDRLINLSDEDLLRVLKEQRVANPEGFPLSNLDKFRDLLGRNPNQTVGEYNVALKKMRGQ
jgi:hypothetical protein